MSWYSIGAAEAERMAQSTQNRSRKNFFTKSGDETATIRFLKPATESFNYKRAFVKKAEGQKLFTTNPLWQPDPFVQSGLTLQPAFAWHILDRRVFEFNDRITGESRSVGPRVMFFADGPRTRKQLLAFEKEQLNLYNEEREEEGLGPVTLEEHNLTSYDIRCSKPKDSPWLFTAKKAKPLSESDRALIENNTFKLEEELAPEPLERIQAMLGLAYGNGGGVANSEEPATSYSYSDEEDDTISFS